MALLAFLLIFAVGIAFSQTTTISVATSEATSVTASSAELHGLINPGGGRAAAWFEWGMTDALGTRSDVQMFPEGTTAVPFAQPLRNLQPHTTYYFRAAGYRSGGTSVSGDILTFTTTGDASTTMHLTATTTDATTVTSTSAALNGTINAGGGSATAWFNWGTSTSMGTRSGVQTFSGTSAVAMAQPLRNLQPHTTYYFRTEAYRSSDGAASLGSVKTFTTTDAPAASSITVTTNDATMVASTSAVLNGTIAGADGPLGAWFDWGTTPSLGARTDAQTFTGTGSVTLTQPLKNLQPHTTYYFRTVVYPAVAGAPNVLGDIRTFTTTAGTPPVLAITTLIASAVSSTSAELRGLIHASVGASTAWFEWGPSTSLANRTSAQTFGSGDSAASNYSFSLTSLQPNTTYYFRAAGQDSAGTVRGEVKTFTTTRVPSTPPQTIPEVEQGEIKSGYVIITPDAGSGAPTPTMTFGTVSRGSVQSQAGIVPTPMTTDASMFVEIIPSISRNIGVAFANPSATVNAVTLTLRDENGFVLGSPAIVSIPGRRQVARFLNELFGSDAVGNGFRGSLRMQSATAFAAIGLRFSGPVFSTLPVAVTAPVPGVPSSTLIAGILPNAPKAGTAGGSNALILPQFAISGGWATQIALVNNSTSTIVGRLDLFDTAGNPMAVTLNGETRSTFTYSIPVGGTFILAPRDSNGQSPL